MKLKKIGVVTLTREYIENICQLGTKKTKAIINQIEKENRDILKKNLEHQNQRSN